MPDLKPGEYMGSDGMIHRAHLHHSVEHGDGWWWPVQDRVLPDDSDFPAAVEALQALVEEPFEWEITERDWPRRWNGGRVERFDEVRDMWLDTGYEETVAFEQGRRYERERGQ